MNKERKKKRQIGKKKEFMIERKEERKKDRKKELSYVVWSKRRKNKWFLTSTNRQEIVLKFRT